MLNAVDTLRRFGADGSVREQSASLLERGLRSIEAVVGAVLETHRGSGKGRPLSPEDLHDLRLLTEPEARRRGLALDWRSEVRSDLPVDATRTRQIVLNLLLNASAASPPGGRIRFEAEAAPGTLRIRVADQGPGLPEEVAARLEGVAAGGAQGHGGQGGDPGADRGMGVAVVMRLVESLEGRVSVRSVPGEGTEVTLELPLAPAEEAAA
jgi:signal transduction histidine kinase